MKKINKILVGLIIITSVIAGFRINALHQERKYQIFMLRVERAQVAHKLDSLAKYDISNPEMAELFCRYCDLNAEIGALK